MIISEMCIHEDLIQFYKAFESHAHPMAIMVGVVGALSSFFDVEKTGYSKEQRE
jgi:citrate synthase